MIVYFDTSAVVPILVDEPTSDGAIELWSRAERIVSSRLVYAEARAALGLARRLDRLDSRQLGRAVGNLEQILEDVDLVEVTDLLVRRAGELAERLALRGYDAVHLASAELVADRDLVLATGDKQLLAAAGELEISTAVL